MKNKKLQPLLIAITGFIIALLFQIIPMNPGYELALAYVPMFFVAMGLVSALIYWISSLLTKSRLDFLFYVLFFGNLFFGLIVTLDMASN